MNDLTCPAQKEWWTTRVYKHFYMELLKADKDGWVTITTKDPIITPADPIIIKRDKAGQRYGEYRGASWKKANIRISWKQGPMANEIFDGIYDWDHWHSSFKIHSHHIHIDFTSFFTGGPQTAYRDYRVFDEGQEIKRGGGFAGFIGGNFKFLRNWPLAVEIDDHLIYIDKFLQRIPRATKGVIDNKNSCSIWIKR